MMDPPSLKKLAAGLTAAIAACAPTPPVPVPAASYHAVGTEPFWNLTIDERTAAFTLAGAGPITQPRPAAIVGIAGEIYRTPRIDVNIVHARCSDGMSDRTYPDKVQVTVDGRQFSGCGGL